MDGRHFGHKTIHKNDLNDIKKQKRNFRLMFSHFLFFSNFIYEQSWQDRKKISKNGEKALGNSSSLFFVCILNSIFYIIPMGRNSIPSILFSSSCDLLILRMIHFMDFDQTYCIILLGASGENSAGEYRYKRIRKKSWRMLKKINNFTFSHNLACMRCSSEL